MRERPRESIRSGRDLRVGRPALTDNFILETLPVALLAWRLGKVDDAGVARITR